MYADSRQQNYQKKPYNKNSDNWDLLVYLYLFFISSSNVWYGPTSFFLDAFFMIICQQVQKARKCTMIDNTLMEQKKSLSELGDS